MVREQPLTKAGRVVIRASLRDRLGLVPGPVELVVDGTDMRVEAIADGRLVEKDGSVVIAADGPPLSADDIRDLRLADQR